MQNKIQDGLSLYLDVVRFFSAIVVVLQHTWGLIFPRFPLPWPGHSAVVIFFVLSGYVIAHASRPELKLGLGGYANHRMARILPVTIAAMLLSIAMFPLAGSPIVPNGGTMQFSWQGLALNFFFLGQSWADIQPVFNPPFWSLNFEVWYYIIFGAWIYIPNRWITLIAIIIAGPRILLLMPIWLLGVVLYKHMPDLSPRRAMYFFIMSILFGLTFIWFDVAAQIRKEMEIVSPRAMALLHGSSMFVGDFIFSLIVAVNFASAASLRMQLLVPLKNVIRFLSSFTFSIYVFHMPLVILLWNGLNIRTASLFYLLLAILIFSFGQLTERQTKFYRPALQRLLGKRPLENVI